MTITVPDKWQPFVRSLVESGRVASAEAVIDEALLLFEERERNFAIGMQANPYLSIVERLIKPLEDTLSPEAARDFLRLRLAAIDEQRWEELSLKARKPGLLPSEQAEYECYRRVNYFLSLLGSKARLSLRRAGLPETGST